MTRAAVWVAALGLVGPAADIKVTPVVLDGRVVASFTAPGAWTAEARELVQAGVRLTLSYDVELRRPAMLFDATLARARVAAAVQFDTLTRSYHLTKSRDDHVIASERADQPAEVRDWMTAFEKVQLEPSEPLEPNADYYVRVRLYVSPRRTISFWLIWPFGRDDGSGRADFTYIR